MALKFLIFTTRRGRIRIAASRLRLSHIGHTVSRAEEGKSGLFRIREPDDFTIQDRSGQTTLPDPRLVRRIISQRQLRARFFEGDLFADPAWDILLDLAAARGEHTRVSVSSLCIAAGVPPTTALRWIAQMTEAALLCRVEDETDRRRAFIALTDKAADAIASYFAEAGQPRLHVSFER